MIYVKKLKWYHRLLNIFGAVFGVIALLFTCIVLALPLYVIVGEDKTAEIIDESLACLWVVEIPRDPGD